VSRCRAKTADGKPCKANARAGRKHCYFHDPKSAESRAAAQANGGAESRNRVGPAKTLGKNAAEVSITGEQEVIGVVTETVNQVRRGQIAPNVAHVIGQLLGVGLKALKQDEQDKKIAELDERTRPLQGLTVEQLLEIARAGRGAPPTTADDASPH